MDLGATCCVPRNPKCEQCPLQGSCVALEKGLTAQLPTPKPKKPREEVFFLSLLLQDSRGHWLLEFQANKGIWQDLWAFPSVSCEPDLTRDNAAQACEAWSQLVGGVKRMEWNPDVLFEMLKVQPWLVHDLTHRKLHFKVVVLRLERVHPACVPLADKPVPAVVHKLIAHSLEHCSAQ